MTCTYCSQDALPGAKLNRQPLCVTCISAWARLDLRIQVGAIRAAALMTPAELQRMRYLHAEVERMKERSEMRHDLTSRGPSLAVVDGRIVSA